MSSKIVQVNFRMPEALKASLEKAAAANHRSLTAEITERLSASLSNDTSAADPRVQDILETNRALAESQKQLARMFSDVISASAAVMRSGAKVPEDVMSTMEEVAKALSSRAEKAAQTTTLSTGSKDAE